MSRDELREAALEVLTTHRHGVKRERCMYCAGYYGGILNKLEEAGFALVAKGGAV